MPTRNDMLWFKTTFGADIVPALAGTPFTLDMMTALACQETGEVWPILSRRAGLTKEQILALCVGDTLDRPKTFPKDKADLLSQTKGSEMFKIARDSLTAMATYVTSYKGAASNPRKFCKGFGLFQYDLQFFLEEPDYFLDKSWATLAGTLGKALLELQRALMKLKLDGKTSLTDLEFAHAAIVYNTGRFVPSRGLKQGYKDSSGKYYGELVYAFLAEAKTVAWPPIPTPGPAPHAAMARALPAPALAGVAKSDYLAFASSWDGLLRDLLHPAGHPEPNEADDELPQSPFAGAVYAKLTSDLPGKRLLVGFDINVFDSDDQPETDAFTRLADRVVADGHLRSIYLEGAFGMTAAVFEAGEAQRFVKAADAAGLVPTAKIKKSKDPSKDTKEFNRLRKEWLANRCWWEKFVKGQLADYLQRGYAAAEIDNLDQVFDDGRATAKSFEQAQFGQLRGILAFFRTYADEYLAGRAPPLILKNIDRETLIELGKHLLPPGAADDRTRIPRDTFADFHICEIKAGTQKSKASTALATASAAIGIQTVFSEHTEHYRAHGAFGAEAQAGKAKLVAPAPTPHAMAAMTAGVAAAPPAALAFADTLAGVAVAEWNLFGQQTQNLTGVTTHSGHKEGENGFYQRVAEYWLVGTNTHGLDGRDHGWPWSAAFISWCERTAGAAARFRYSTQHSVYISQSIRDHLNNRPAAGYWGHRLSEAKPAVGDLVCWSRQAGVDFDHQHSGDYKGHCDIVVAVGAGQIEIIGGNVGDSVTRRPLALDANGFIKPVVVSGETLFALMKNRIA